MEAVQNVEHPTFETVWAGLQEVRQILKENAEQQRKDAADFNDRIGGLTNLFGEITEHIMAPKLREQFRELGLDFPQASRNIKVNDRVNDISFETDVKLENGDKVMVIEIKTKLTVERINKHIERLEKMRTYADLHEDKRTFLGAVAGVVVTDEVRNYALNQGFFVIEPVGENLNITPPNGKPKEY
jgi:molybdopterin converting factor small subunit